MPHLSSQFVSCPRCEGRGYSRPNLVCKECGGIGLGTFVKNDFLYWGYRLTPAKIIVRHSQLIFDRAVLLALALAGLGGLISLGWWMAEQTIAPTGQIYLGRALTFWREQDVRILFFWAGMLCLAFAYVRRQRSRERFAPVKILQYRKWQKFQQQPQHIPNNWQELRLFRTKYDVSRSYDEQLTLILEQAYLLAEGMNHREAMPAHVMMVLLNPAKALRKNKHIAAVKDFFARLDVHEGKVVPKLKNALQTIEVRPADGAKTKPEVVVSRELQKCLIEGYLIAQQRRHERVRVLDIVTPLLANDPLLNGLCNELGISIEQAAHVADWLELQAVAAQRRQWRERYRRARWQRRLKRATNAVAVPVLQHFCTDLTEAARAGRLPVYLDRQQPLSALLSALAQGKKRVLLTGPAGAGKYTLLQALAERMAYYDVPEILRRKKLLLLDTEKLTKEGGDMPFEKKLLVVLHEAGVAGDVVLAVRDIGADLALALQSVAGKVIIVVSAVQMFDGWQDAAVPVDAPQANEVAVLLSGQALALEAEGNVYFKQEALALAAQAGGRHISGQSAMTGAVALLNQTAQTAARNRERVVDAAVVAKTAAAMSGTPYTKILKQ